LENDNFGDLVAVYSAFVDLTCFDSKPPRQAIDTLWQGGNKFRYVQAGLQTSRARSVLGSGCSV
jgi:hypothetical protein